ncbi:MAG: type II secretion system protein [Candidatus Saccharibacteria bacterium]
MLKSSRGLQMGDTLIEVLFAVTVFSLVAVGSLSIMNQGTATAQRSLEISLVRQQIDAQAETLRFIHDSYIAAYPDSMAVGDAALEWDDPNPINNNKIVDNTVPTATDFGTCPASLAGLTGMGARPFILNTKTAKLETPGTKITFAAPTFAQLRYDTVVPTNLVQAEGIWIEAVQGTGTSSNFIDFHIRACWESSGQAKKMSLGTIVRLYEPK